MVLIKKICIATVSKKNYTMIDILRNRRSVRKYTNKPVETEKIEILKEALLLSPSSKNSNTWEFVFVDEHEIIKQLKDCKPHGTTSLQTAPLAVVICADETKNDVWIEDCSIASILIQLTAQSMGLASCWVQIRNRMFSESISSEEYIQQLLSIPKHFRVLSILTIGYPEKQRDGKPKEELQFEKIRLNRF